MKGRAIVTGHSSGLGAEIARQLVMDGWSVVGWSRHPEEVLEHDRKYVDVTCVWQIQQAAKALVEPVDVIVNCAGVNHICWHEDLSVDMWDQLMDTNARAIWLTARELIREGKFKRPATVVNIVSNASHVPMTNSAAYNASKGAAHILTLQMARELRKRHGITVFGISPNKLAGTGMSRYIEGRVCSLRGMTPEEARDYQLAALPAGEETDPARVAEFLVFLLSGRDRHKFLHGTVIPYGA